jgi:Uma2 family endonuclease
LVRRKDEGAIVTGETVGAIGLCSSIVSGAFSIFKALLKAGVRMELSFASECAMVTLQFRQMVVYPGETIHLQDVEWHEFEAIVAELEDRRASRIAYFDRILELRMPLAKHEKAKILLGNMVTILLEELRIPNECFGSTTFKRKDLGVGVEPDDCFYIQNAEQVRDRDELDLTIDPPPDLVIEVDVTSKTGLSVYQQLGVPEVWRFENGQLLISVLAQGEYRDSEVSPQFPQFPIVPAVAEFIIRIRTEGRMQTLISFREYVRSHLKIL